MNGAESRTESPSAERPRIYVACLAAYNRGTLHGRWIDAAEGTDKIHEEINAMLAASPVAQAAEFAIHDHEGFWSAEIDEFSAIDRVAELAAFISEHGRLGAELVTHFGGDIGYAREALNDYAGAHKSLGDFAAELTEETGDLAGTQGIPANLIHYINWDFMGHDMELNGDIFIIETGYEEIHVFWNR